MRLSLQRHISFVSGFSRIEYVRFSDLTLSGNTRSQQYGLVSKRRKSQKTWGFVPGSIASFPHFPANRPALRSRVMLAAPLSIQKRGSNRPFTVRKTAGIAKTGHYAVTVESIAEGGCQAPESVEGSAVVREGFVGSEYPSNTASAHLGDSSKAASGSRRNDAVHAQILDRLSVMVKACTRDSTTNARRVASARNWGWHCR